VAVAAGVTSQEEVAAAEAVVLAASVVAVLVVVAPVAAGNFFNLKIHAQNKTNSCFKLFSYHMQFAMLFTNCD
jgi:4-hydroxybenzoate polyprenyltransferase